MKKEKADMDIKMIFCLQGRCYECCEENIFEQLEGAKELIRTTEPGTPIKLRLKRQRSPQNLIS
jgi:hypothetical protein